jgi:hypothetical protein
MSLPRLKQLRTRGVLHDDVEDFDQGVANDDTLCENEDEDGDGDGNYVTSFRRSTKLIWAPDEGVADRVSGNTPRQSWAAYFLSLCLLSGWYRGLR